MRTKSDVKREFTYLRTLMRHANIVMDSKELELDNAEALANEMIASATVFLEWVDTQREKNNETL